MEGVCLGFMWRSGRGIMRFITCWLADFPGTEKKGGFQEYFGQ